MQTNKRLENALLKLYTAFHGDTLNPTCCKQCAVGNMVDQTDAWKNFSDRHGSTQLNYVGLVHERIGRRINGYLPSELLKIEKTFLEACGFETPLLKSSRRPKNPTNKDLLYNGLSKTIKFLYTLDGKNSPMDFNILLDYVPSSKNDMHAGTSVQVAESI